MYVCIYIYIFPTHNQLNKKNKQNLKKKKKKTHTHNTFCIGVVYITPGKAVTCNFSKLGCSMQWLVYCKHPPDITHAVLQRIRFESGFSYRAKSKEKKNNRKKESNKKRTYNFR